MLDSVSVYGSIAFLLGHVQGVQRIRGINAIIKNPTLPAHGMALREAQREATDANLLRKIVVELKKC